MSIKNKIISIFTNKPQILLYLFLPFYFALVFRLHKDSMEGDEQSYMYFANNLINGYYSPEAPDINLWHGPGYPMIVVFFLIFNKPFILITLSNAIFQFLSVMFLYYSIKKMSNSFFAIFFAIFWGFNFMAYQEMPMILSESFSVLLVTLIIYFLVLIHKTYKLIYLLILGFLLGYLALTKVIFGYVILCMIFLYSFIALKTTKNYKSIYILFLALLINSPYLYYTNSLTGNYFYWGNSGGNLLYWMSTPHEGEYGDWNNNSFTANCNGFYANFCNSDLIRKNHQNDIKYIESLPKVRQDLAYKKIAFENIINQPIKFLKNIGSNFSRLLFNFPFSYSLQRESTIIRIMINSFVLITMIINFILFLVFFKRINSSFLFLNLLFYFYISLTLILSASNRQFNIVIPIILFNFVIFLKHINKSRLVSNLFKF